MVGPAPAADDAGAPAAVPGLYRSATDRLLFGVCGGIAERYGFEPLLVRIGFALTLLLGGSGVLFYLAAVFLIPAAPAGDGGAGRPAPGGAVGVAGGVLRVLVALAVGIAVLCALGAAAVAVFAATAFFGAWPAAVALAGVGVLLLLSARSRRATGTLLVLALALAVPATTAVVADVRVDRSLGDDEVRPATQARAARGYGLGVGRLVVDLRALRLERGDRLTVPAHVDVGRLAVILPRDACVAWTVHTHTQLAGHTDVLQGGARRDDWRTDTGGRRTVEIDPPSSAGSRRPRVTLELRNGVGEIVVARSRRELDGYAGRTTDVASPGDDLLRTDACRPGRGGR
jgi:phage shock protein PspC (stress-responsive transcriptional regulator)